VETAFVIPVQVIAIIFGLFMMYVAHIHFRKHQLDFWEYILWMVVWATLIVVSFWPQTVKGIVQALSISRVFDLLVLIALMVLAYVTFNTRLTTRQLRKKIEEIIRQRALLEPIEIIEKKKK
jgi:hypothetical protein